jgi:Protein of unknown function (DUF2505)
MPRPIEHHTNSPYPAARVYAALTDEEFLRARLKRLGGKRSELASFSTVGGATRYSLRQMIDAEHIPSVARSVVRGDLVIERTESWTRNNSEYDGTVDASIPGTPGSVHAVTSLLDTGSGSELILTGTVKVRVPFVGGKLEDLIVKQLTALLRAEGQFTQHWLETHDARP